MLRKQIFPPAGRERRGLSHLAFFQRQFLAGAGTGDMPGPQIDCSSPLGGRGHGPSCPYAPSPRPSPPMGERVILSGDRPLPPRGRGKFYKNSHSNGPGPLARVGAKPGFAPAHASRQQTAYRLNVKGGMRFETVSTPIFFVALSVNERSRYLKY